MVFNDMQVLRYSTQGFTLVEMLVSISILVLFALVSIIGFKNMLYSSALKAATTETYSALTTAREHTLSSQNDTVYGVRVSSTTVTYFQGAAYVLGASTNKVYVFERGVTATGTLVSSESDVIFTRLSGQASNQGTIYIRDVDATATTSIVIRASGLIEYQ